MGYVKKLLKQAAELKRGGIHHATISHDPWCPCLAGVGPCTCDATIQIESSMNRKQRRAMKRRRK